MRKGSGGGGGKWLWQHKNLAGRFGSNVGSGKFFKKIFGGTSVTDVPFPYTFPQPVVLCVQCGVVPCAVLWPLQAGQKRSAGRNRSPGAAAGSPALSPKAVLMVPATGSIPRRKVALGGTLQAPLEAVCGCNSPNTCSWPVPLLALPKAPHFSTGLILQFCIVPWPVFHVSHVWPVSHVAVTMVQVL